VSWGGREWARLEDYDDDDKSETRAVFPDMSDRSNVTFGKRSGLIIID